MSAEDLCPHSKLKRSDCLVCVQEDNRRAWRAELARELQAFDMGNTDADSVVGQHFMLLEKINEIAEEGP